MTAEKELKQAVSLYRSGWTKADRVFAKKTIERLLPLSLTTLKKYNPTLRKSITVYRGIKSKKGSGGVSATLDRKVAARFSKVGATGGFKTDSKTGNEYKIGGRKVRGSVLKTVLQKGVPAFDFVRVAGFDWNGEKEIFTHASNFGSAKSPKIKRLKGSPTSKKGGGGG